MEHLLPNILLLHLSLNLLLNPNNQLLIAEFGQRVNLAGINPDVIASVESQRRGFMSKAAFGISYLRKEPESGPASKFIYYIIKTKNPIDQGECN